MPLGGLGGFGLGAELLEQLGETVGRLELWAVTAGFDHLEPRGWHLTQDPLGSAGWAGDPSP